MPPRLYPVSLTLEISTLHPPTSHLPSERQRRLRFCSVAEYGMAGDAVAYPL
jgi:hypothetical protein